MSKRKFGTRVTANYLEVRPITVRVSHIIPVPGDEALVKLTVKEAERLRDHLQEALLYVAGVGPKTANIREERS